MTTSFLWIYGLHAAEAFLEKKPESIIRVYLQKERNDIRIKTLFTKASTFNLPLEWINKEKLQKLIGQEVPHQGIILQCRYPKVFDDHDLAQFLDASTTTPLILVLDQVQDPHNLGACLRSAAASGIQAVVIPKDRSVGLTGTVCKVASGAVALVPLVEVTNLARTMSQLKERGIWLYGAAAEATETLYQANFRMATAIVLGAEGSGLRRLTRELCDQLLRIPMQNGLASLNVSVATGIFLFEAVRQRFLGPASK